MENKHEQARKDVNELVPLDKITPSQIDDLLDYITSCEKTEKELISNSLKQHDNDTKVIGSLEIYIDKFEQKYEELKNKVDTFYAEMSMYIGNNIMIEQEEFDVNYVWNLVEKLSNIGATK